MNNPAPYQDETAIGGDAKQHKTVTKVKDNT